jgi:hypothetical protein
MRRDLARGASEEWGASGGSGSKPAHTDVLATGA